MLALHLMNYKITFDPAYALDVLNNMWATEPVGATSITLTCLGLFLTLTFKLVDFLWDIYKEKARQGRLRIDLSVERLTLGSEPMLCVVISNVGREPIVLRDIGYAKPRLFGAEFVRMIADNDPLPHALNARELIRLTVSDEPEALQQLIATFRVKDSLGKLWEAPDSECRRARRQLKVFLRSGKQAKRNIQINEAAIKPPTDAAEGVPVEAGH